MARIQRRIDKSNLVRELSENKIDALELLREALANAKDHGAKTVWIKTVRGTGAKPEPDVFLFNDGEGMTDEHLSAFWGVSSSVKSGASIGYKGHGTKLFFAARRLHVVTRVDDKSPWRLSSLDNPSQSNDDDVSIEPLPAKHRLMAELATIGLDKRHGVGIWIEGCSFSDAPARLLSRRTIESYCDWFTVIGDVRSGLFRSREKFHDAVDKQTAEYTALRVNEVPLRPIELQLCINGERAYEAYGCGKERRDPEFLSAWTEDRKQYAKKPAILALGHRFADHHESGSGASRVRDDLTSLCLLGPDTFGDDNEYAIVLRIEGHRRQRETYLEASWQNHAGEYGFEDRFGLWLCRDFVPVMQQNDWLREAIDRGGRKKNRLTRFEIKTLRNWHVFVNHQGLSLTANRNSISNLETVKDRVITLVADRIEKVLEEQKFADWLAHMQTSVMRAQRDKEVSQMRTRVEKMKAWFSKRDGVEPEKLERLERLDEDESIRLPTPSNEQELFHLYAVLSGAFRTPLRILEYNTREGIDAVAQVRDEDLFDDKASLKRVEFKFEIAANYSVDHYFDAIDAFICWKVGGTGDLPEGGESSAQGKLRKRTPRSAGKCDTHEVEYTTSDGKKRVIPVLALESLFNAKKGKK